MISSFKPLCCLLFSLWGTFTLSAQQNTLPQDPDLRTGKLKNGLTYYIKANKIPENQADFYLVQKTGSIQEDSTQRGLAHFLEHMAFNGSKNFPGKAMIHYLEGIGVKFGNNLNAYTAFDETVYNITNVAMTRGSILDSVLLVLHDWSGELTLSDEEIERERGVIIEEWRTRNDASQRINEALFRQIFTDCKYGNCMPIGDMEVIANFVGDELRSFYKKWYRPDLQAVIVVGDISVDRVEEQIQRIFGSLPAGDRSALRRDEQVPDYQETCFAQVTDKENDLTALGVMYKQKSYPEERKQTKDYMFEMYLRQTVVAMLNNRLNELLMQSDPPFVDASIEEGPMLGTKTREAFHLSLVPHEGAEEKGLEAVLTEVRRAVLHGFAESEFVRIRDQFLRRSEQSYRERDKQENSRLVPELIRLFLENEPVIGIEQEHLLWQEIASLATVEDANRYLRERSFDLDNSAFYLIAPEKEGANLPQKEQLLAIARRVDQSSPEPYADQVRQEPLISQLPVQGTLKRVGGKRGFESAEWVLSNGIRVLLKTTDYKKDQLMVKGFSPGGASLLPHGDCVNYALLNRIIPIGGYGDFNAVELSKALSGKVAMVDVNVGMYAEEINGSCSPQDIETMMQLLYLKLTAPRKDEAAFASYITRLKEGLRNQDMDPNTAYSDSIVATLYGNNPWMARLRSEMLDQVDYDRLLEIYRERMENITDMTLIFTGSITPEALEPMLLRYLSAIPGKGKREKAKDLSLVLPASSVKKEFSKPLTTPMTSVFSVMWGPCKYTLENKIKFSVLEQLLTLVYTEKIREEEGGTYGVGVWHALSVFPRSEYTLAFTFNTDPQKKEYLLSIAYKEQERMAQEGPRQQDLNKVKEYMLKQLSEQEKNNLYWQGVLYEQERNHIDMYTRYRQHVEKLTVGDIQKFARKLLKKGKRAEVVMNPERSLD